VLADVYPGTAASAVGELTAASFAKLASVAPADVAHALLGLVGENVALIATAHARNRCDAIVYCGSPLTDGGVLQQIIAQFAALAGIEAVFPARGAWCGAVGAAESPRS